MFRNSFKFILSVILILSSASRASAQAVSGNIDGTVFDSSGAVVPDVTITITDLDHGSVYHTQSNAQGNYFQPHLLAGRYQVRFESQGFAAFSINAIVQVDSTTRVEARLNPASAQTSISVTDETPLLVTDRAEVATTFTGREVQELPLLDRNVTTLLQVVPGAQLNSGLPGAAEFAPQGAQANVNGQFFAANGFLLDGTENESAILGQPVVNPNIDALQDIKVSTGNYDAEFGSASGALIQATTKSGTNQFHGSLFEFLRNNITNAADPFTRLNPPIRWNQYGGSLGGPIRKEKLFGFFDYQATRRRTGGSLITTVPTQAERSGDLTALLGNYICNDGSVSATPCSNPVLVTTTEGATVPAQAGMVFDPTTGDPSTGVGRQVFAKGGQVNIVPVTPAIAKLLNNLPAANLGTGVTQNYLAVGGQRFDTSQYDGRVDYNFNTFTHLFSRYTIANFNIYGPAAYGDLGGGPSFFGFSGKALDRDQSLAIGVDHAFGPKLTADLRIGFYRYRVRSQPLGSGTPATDAGLPGLNTGSPETSGMPAFYINGNGGFVFGYALGVNGCNCPLKETENHFQWVTNWRKDWNNHAIKFGVDIRRAQQQRVPSDLHRSGEIFFSDSVTGNPTVDNIAAGKASTGSALGSFLLADTSSFGRYFTGSGYTPGLRQTRLFLYLGDSWRVTTKLTLNYGLRWENYLPQTAAKRGGAGSFDPATGEVLAAGIGSVPFNLGVKAYNLGFAPRIGVAYQIMPRTVLRAGYGRSFNPNAFGAVFGQGADYNPPIVNPQNVPQPNPYVPAFNLLNGPPAPVNPPVGANGRYLLPDGLGINYFTSPLNSYRIPGADFWNLTVEHEFGGNLALEVGYVGNVGRHLYESINVNQAVPGPGNFSPRRPFFPKFGLEQGIFQVCNCGNSNYHSLQSKLQKRFSHGLDFQLAYTWAKALDTSEGGGGFADNYHINDSYGPASWDRTHTLTLAHNWDLPFGHNQHWNLGNNRVANVILGGWRLSGIHTFASGLPFTPTVSNSLVNADFNYVRADIIGKPSVSNPNRVQWFNPAAFTGPQQPFRNGTSSRNSLRGPREVVSNLSASKNFWITERKSLEFQAEAYNVFNHVNLGQPNSTIDVLGAGQITYTQFAMRQMQFGLHFLF